jgi:hypothetical protein
MDESTLIRLDLRAPLVFTRAPGIVPFPRAAPEADSAGHVQNRASSGGERLFCFELDPAQARSIEPDRGLLLGALLFAGLAGKDAAEKDVTENGVAENPDAGKAADTHDAVTLPAGLYLFAQQREELDREACLDMAIEQQKDGLWERHGLEPVLYVRYLFEDGKPVTQIFRPCKKFTSTTGC